MERKPADLGSPVNRDVNIEFFPNPDIECDNPVKIRISDFIRAA